MMILEYDFVFGVTYFFLIPSLKTNSSENGWVEDERFLFGKVYCQGLCEGGTLVGGCWLIHQRYYVSMIVYPGALGSVPLVAQLITITWEKYPYNNKSVQSAPPTSINGFVSFIQLKHLSAFHEAFGWENHPVTLGFKRFRPRTAHLKLFP